MGSKVIEGLDALLKANNNISFVCIYHKDDFHYLQGMIDTLPSDSEIVLMEVKEGEKEEVKITYSNKYKKLGYITLPEFRFDKARNLAKSVATYNWIFSIDADERLCIDQHKGIKELINLDYESFTMRVYDVTKNTGGVVRRLFKKKYDWFGACHEQILTEKNLDTKVLIRHVGYSNTDPIPKLERNLNLMLQDKENNLKIYYREKIIQTIKEIEKWQEKHQ